MPARILLADGDKTSRTLLRLKLNAACYEISEASDPEGLFATARVNRPDIIIISADLSGHDGYAACAQLKAQEDLAQIPIVMIIEANSNDGRIKSLECGADEYLTRPVDELVLLARTRSLRKASATLNELQLRAATSSALGFAEPNMHFIQPGRVGLIFGHQTQVQSWHSHLCSALGTSVKIYNPDELLTMTTINQCPDVFVIPGDLRHPDEGLRLLSELRSNTTTRHAAVIMILRPQAQQQAVLALDMGANDLMYEGFSPRELVLRIKAQIRNKQRADHLRQSLDKELKLAAIDPLTGLYNRRYAYAHLKRISNHAVQNGRSFALMILDIDRFKAVNDQYGHAAGDHIIKEVSHRLKQHLRAEDLIARIGGEEFLIALSGTTLTETQHVSERLRHSVECSPILYGPSGVSISITISIGAAISSADCDTDDLMLQADQALYQAKNTGRNRVRFTETAH